MRLIFEDQIKVQVLGSGSKGNSLLIASGGEVLLVDAGLSGKEIIRRLECSGMVLDQISGVILTHEHNDHVRGLKGLLKVVDTPVWANEQTLSHLGSSGYQIKEPNIFETGEEFTVGDMSVDSFSVPHDAYDPCGFVVTTNGISVGILTDLGYGTDAVRKAVSKCHILFLEANYDEQLLSADVKRPWATKQRISARHGHLSNVQASEILASLKGMNSPLRHVFLGHMSEDCNDPDIAVMEIRKGLDEAGASGVGVHLTYQARASEAVII